jgi:predicted DNA-binding transcriptional regulator AlpA
MPVVKSTAADPAVIGAPLPNPTLPQPGFVRQPQVLALVPNSKSTLWRRIQARSFPQPLKLSERVTVWRAEDIRRWIEFQARGGDADGDGRSG